MHERGFEPPVRGKRAAGGARTGFALALLVLTAGCPPRRDTQAPVMQPQEPLPPDLAILIVNGNAARIVSGLRASGSARGQIIEPEGNKRSFDFTGKLLLVPPRHLRFDLQNGLGQTEVLFGSNDAMFWLYVMRDQDTLRFGRYQTPDESRAMKPSLRPDWLIEALGLNPIPFEAEGAVGPVQIVEAASQRLFIVDEAGASGARVSKEYVLSRYPPRLVEAVVWRDEIGSVRMRSALGEYRQLDEQGAYLPYHIRVEWPQQDAWLEYDVSRWEEREELTPDAPAFQLGSPSALTREYRRVIDIDSGQTVSPDSEP